MMDLVFMAGLLTGLALTLVWLAVADARRLEVEPRAVVAFCVLALLWRLARAEWVVAAAGIGEGLLGALLGAAVVMAPICVAELRRRRWPVYPGDAMLLGAFGWLLGPVGLMWSLLLGSLCALVHRACVQRRRGRPFGKGYLPLAPGLCLGCLLVFAGLEAGLLRAVPVSAVEMDAVEVRPIPATVSGPPVPVLPPEVAARRVKLVLEDPLPFAALAAALSRAAGVAVAIEERPGRLAEGEAALPPLPALTMVHDGPLPDLLDDLARRGGHAWTWVAASPRRAAGIVFYRHRDAAWPAEHPMQEPGPGRSAAAGVPGGGPEGQAASPEGPSLPVDEPTVRPEGGVELSDGVPEETEDAGAGPDAGGEAGAPEAWRVDPGAQGTLRGVLEAWAARAGWSLVWRAPRDYSLGAPAVFGGGFLEAVDGLLSDAATRRSLVAVAWPENRHLVIEGSGGGGE